jgi:SAM-dependent methyltransferase
MSLSAALAASRRWEHNTVDPLVADIFGFHALQVGASHFDGLAASRMPHRWTLCEASLGDIDVKTRGSRLVGDSAALPFPASSIDLVLMPHTLEYTADPHAALREAERVLVPEGRLVLTGFNPLGLWGASRRWHRWRGGELSSGEWLAPWRLRDWLHLLNFEVETSRFGCFAPLWAPDPWHMNRHWSQRLGDRWFPMAGGVYALVAVKRLPGVRLLGLRRQRHLRRHRGAAVVGAQSVGAQEPLTRNGWKERMDGCD